MVARVRRSLGLLVAALCTVAPLEAQTPRPAPPPAPPVATPTPAPAGSAAAPATAAPVAPSETELGVPIYPNAVTLGAFDAGRGQRYHLFGVAASFTEAVAFYRTALKAKGDVVFDTPPTHIFETGRFRQETMAFPPSVTVKDYTSGGLAGYPNHRGGQPERFPTVLQIVAVTPGAGDRSRSQRSALNS